MKTKWKPEKFELHYQKDFVRLLFLYFLEKKSKLHTLVRFILKRTLASCCSSISKKRKSKQVPKPVASYQDFDHLLFRPFLEKN